MNYKHKSAIFGVAVVIILLGLSLALFQMSGSTEEAINTGEPTPGVSTPAVAPPPAIVGEDEEPSEGGLQEGQEVANDTFVFELPDGAIGGVAASGMTDSLDYKRGPVRVSLVAREKLAVETIADVTKLYGDWTQAEKVGVAGKRGYLFETKSGDFIVYTAVTIASENVYTVQTAAPVAEAAKAKQELLVASGLLTPRPKKR